MTHPSAESTSPCAVTLHGEACDDDLHARPSVSSSLSLSLSLSLTHTHTRARARGPEGVAGEGEGVEVEEAKAGIEGGELIVLQGQAAKGGQRREAAGEDQLRRRGTMRFRI